MQGTPVVVITGASAGIGAALAQLLGSAPERYRLVLAARRQPELTRVANAAGPDALAVVSDVTRRPDVQRIADSALERYGQIDVWINNAGRGISRQVSELRDEDIDEMMLVNVKSVLYGIQAVLPHFKQRGRGHIINISSMLGRIPLAGMRSAYSASKHAVNALTANLRMELRDEYPNIHVSTVLPGVVATDFGKNALHGGMDSSSFPGAQSAEEVARVIADVIANPRADVYTRPEARALVARYYGADDMAEVERQFNIAGPASARR